MEQDLNKHDQAKNKSWGGKREGAGGRTMADRLTQAQAKTAYAVIEAEAWIKLADKAYIRMREILDNPDSPAELLKFAMKEANDRAFGKPKESTDITSKGKRIFCLPSELINKNGIDSSSSDDRK